MPSKADSAEIEEVANDLEGQLIEEQGALYDDPLGWVMAAFPWGVEGTILDGQEGPDVWQRERLEELEAAIKDRAFDGVAAVESIQQATASGHGIGKSAFVAWIILFIMSTRPHCKGVVTANTANQLSTKTWAEVAKWHAVCWTKHWFRVTTGAGHMKIVHVEHPETWRVDAITWKKESAEAFAGLHCANSTPFYIFDEASLIADEIWEVAEGGMTDGEPMWFCFGNPTRNTGAFHRCFHGQKHRWSTKQIDARTSRIANKKRMQRWIDDYGIDSDFVKVRALGLFPSVGERQLIPQNIVAESRRRDPQCSLDDPLIIGVDVARDPAGDQSVIVVRKGLDARTYRALRFRGVEVDWLGDKVSDIASELHADAIMVDGGGVGAGTYARLVRIGWTNVYNVAFGGGAIKNRVYANKRAEMWYRLREWLMNGGAIEDHQELEDDLVGPTYDYTLKNDLLKLESKDDMKLRGLSSPDWGDALALTFAKIIPPRENAGRVGLLKPGGPGVVQSQHDPWDEDRVLATHPKEHDPWS